MTTRYAMIRERGISMAVVAACEASANAQDRFLFGGKLMAVIAQACSEGQIALSNSDSRLNAFSHNC